MCSRKVVPSPRWLNFEACAALRESTFAPLVITKSTWAFDSLMSVYTRGVRCPERAMVADA